MAPLAPEFCPILQCALEGALERMCDALDLGSMSNCEPEGERGSPPENRSTSLSLLEWHLDGK